MTRSASAGSRRNARLRRAAELGAGVALLVGWWVTLAPTGIGGPATYVVIRGDSMVPAFESGDLVIVRSSRAYAIGDVVAYRVPEGELGQGRIVIHRIVGGDASAGFVVLGDNNPAPDPWRPRTADVAGRAWLTLPVVGRAVAFVHQPAAAGALTVAALVVVLVLRLPSRVPVARLAAAQATLSGAERDT